MSLPLEVARLVLRDDEPSPGHCITQNDYDGRLGIRISSIFVILVGSVFGRYCKMRVESNDPLTHTRRRLPGVR